MLFGLVTERRIFEFLYSQIDFVSESTLKMMIPSTRVKMESLLEVYCEKNLINVVSEGGKKAYRLSEKGRKVVDLSRELDKLLN